MTWRGEWKPRDLEIVVSGGSGFDSFSAGGIAYSLSIIAPGMGNYSVVVEDGDGHGLLIRSKLNGNALIKERYCLDPNTTQIYTITGPDGTYKLRVCFDNYNNG